MKIVPCQLDFKYKSQIYLNFIKFLKYFSTRKKESEQIDYLFTISGYLKQYKKWFIEKLMEEAKALNWQKVFILWETNKKEYSFDEKNNIEIFSFLAWEEKNKKFQNAKVIISRAGFSRIKQKSYFIPYSKPNWATVSSKIFMREKIFCKMGKCRK